MLKAEIILSNWRIIFHLIAITISKDVMTRCFIFAQLENINALINTSYREKERNFYSQFINYFTN